MPAGSSLQNNQTRPQLTISIYIAQILPYQIRQRLLGLAIKAEFAAAESPAGRESIAYKQVISDIDRVTADARAQFPHFYKA